MKNIILVEDNKIERRNIGRIVEGMEECSLVGVFFNGVEALNFINENDVDIVITDVQMPLMDGIELSKNIRHSGLDVEIIIISGYQDFDNAKSAIGLDVVDYVMKPVINNELEDAISKAIEKIELKKSKASDYEQMQEQIELSKCFLIEQFVKSLVISSDIQDDYIRKHEALFKINITDGYKSVLLIKVNEDKNKDLIRTLYSINSHILEYKSDEVKFYSFVISESEVCVVVTGNDVCSLLAQSILLKNEIAFTRDLQVFTAISSFSKDVHSISVMYDESREMMKKAMDKSGIVWVYDDKESNDLTIMQAKLKRSILSGDLEQITALLNEQIKLCTDEDSKKNFACIYINMLEIILAELGGEFYDNELISAYKVWGKINDFKSIASIENFLLNLTKIVTEKLGEVDNERFKVVNKIKRIIKERYSEHITVELIAKEVSFSRKHVHRIFTQEVGVSIYEYLTDYRIDMAKKLILENDSIDDIVFKIGYKDVKYFYEIFREKTGMTPKQYKEFEKLKQNKQD